MKEGIPFVKESQKTIKLAPVLARYYPDLDFGKSRCPVGTLLQQLGVYGIQIHPDILGELRDGSTRYAKRLKHDTAELLLLNALMREPDWSTPSPAYAMGKIVEEGNNLERRSVWGVLASEGLTHAISEQMKIEPRRVSHLLRGIRIDGAYFALANKAAWDMLKTVTHEYATDYQKQPESIQHNGEMVIRMDNAKTPLELYMSLYKGDGNVQSGRRIAGFVPYEMHYWKWLIENGFISQSGHLPFSHLVLDAHSKGLQVNDLINKRVREHTGIPNDPNVTISRMQLIRNDIPVGFT